MQRLKENVTFIHPEAAEEIRSIAEEQDDDEQDFADTEDMFEDLFKEFEEDDDGSSYFYSEDVQNQDKEEQKELNSLIKTSSINQLFRKLLRELHPDREPNEALRKEKNRLVGQLVEARDSGDIMTLFNLYAEHIGESPLAAIGTDVEKATKILQKQFEQLRDQQDNSLQALSPIDYSIYLRFHKKSKKASDKEIEEHLSWIKKESEEMFDFCSSVTSLAKLKPYLQSRYDQKMQDMTTNTLMDIFYSYENNFNL